MTSTILTRTSAGSRGAPVRGPRSTGGHSETTRASNSSTGLLQDARVVLAEAAGRRNDREATASPVTTARPEPASRFPLPLPTTAPPQPRSTFPPPEEWPAADPFLQTATSSPHHTPATPTVSPLSLLESPLLGLEMPILPQGPPPSTRQLWEGVLGPLHGLLAADWDGVINGTIGHRFPRTLPVDSPLLLQETPLAERRHCFGHYALLRNTVIPNLPMGQMRSRRGGIFALPIVNQHTQMKPYGACKEQTIEMWIWELLSYGERFQIFPSILAAEMEQGTHLTGACKNQLLKAIKDEEHMWEDVYDLTPRRDPNRVDLALQYLEDMILAYLIMFCGSAPTTSEAIQLTIDTAVMPTGNVSEIYSLYKRVLTLHQDLDEAHLPSYAKV
ncbi:hypothetical protein B484DRAFT_461578, partial [Ochromonadaceae sp. CCMP2298]